MILCPDAPEWSAVVWRPQPMTQPAPAEEINELLWCVREVGFLIPVRPEEALVLILPTGYSVFPDLQRLATEDFPALRARVLETRSPKGDLQLMGTSLPRMRHADFKRAGFTFDKQWQWPFVDAVAHAFLVGLGVLTNPS